ncbi:DEAD/DEAH box helicase [Geobacter sulfurreducens]|jgi:ATP-dependent RNA helicase RhlB|uniref:ATP-dependent RNA helicase RhlB n=1 Tax=Geobacter sulfurreducens (strain ATCC 51573 / DSM 12127 / PCA) TaxID=243231 RepID=Q74FT4_GEOSL|nr:DEAD/DEAH box helicase [Geobacter sulfurreducens]AAR33853.1 ATP-dependent RNA helicase RhlB [Geobacter sulfurreducens PCA]ADI83374.2 ATP-dependent RNA helicase RhlB [Geobacter sulfurreducens KN400]AJY70274.1 RNA helicase [Geobacter sulfurreducens]QVW35778.1 DEAD/DEAH box helicase [Geobacter sulfurreducens]UAC04599.1 DEAD/DEAH box helicase [Geobacter sulfurreducens]
MKFADLNLPEQVMQGVADAGFSDCTPIQEKTLPLSLGGKDVAGQAQTGTGKTAAFLISLFTKLLRSGRGGERRHPRAIILAPTRELVVQIEKDAQVLGAHCGFTIQAIYGGVDYMKQKNALKEGADVVVGTPGRLIDYLKQKVYSLKEIEMLVIDEADRMFDMGFIADLRFILRRLPPYDKRQNLMFSATLNQRVMELAYEFMNVPEKVAVTPEQMTAERVEQVLYHVGRKEKFPLLLGLLRKEGMERTMIFVNTKREAEFLDERLNANDFPCRVISGDVEQRKRLKILEDFKSGKLPIMIATDVASRGLHIDGVSHVINYDLPQDAEDYVHRIGRTARAGAEGKAISMADEDGAFHLEAIHEYIKDKIPVEWAEDDLFVHDFKRVKPRPKGQETRAKGPTRHGRKHPEAEKKEPEGEKKKRSRPRRKKNPAAGEGGTPPAAE